MSDSSAYIPGMCNINKAEVAYRKKAMWFGITLGFAVVIVCVLLSANPIVTGLLVFVPTYIAAIGHLQVKNKFCVSYGSKGQQNAAEGSATALAVEEADAREKDKKKARVMNLQALIITLVVVAISALLVALV